MRKIEIKDKEIYIEDAPIATIPSTVLADLAHHNIDVAEEVTSLLMDHIKLNYNLTNEEETEYKKKIIEQLNES